MQGRRRQIQSPANSTTIMKGRLIGIRMIRLVWMKGRMRRRSMLRLMLGMWRRMVHIDMWSVMMVELVMMLRREGGLRVDYHGMVRGGCGDGGGDAVA